jgi:DNA-directed RNA polymerase subunit RPC12/RpoP
MTGGGGGDRVSNDCPRCGATVADREGRVVLTCPYCGARVPLGPRQRQALEVERKQLVAELAQWDARVHDVVITSPSPLGGAAKWGCLGYIIGFLAGAFIAGFRQLNDDIVVRNQEMSVAFGLAVILAVVVAWRRLNAREARVHKAVVERDAATAPVRRRLADVDAMLAGLDADSGSGVMIRA